MVCVLFFISFLFFFVVVVLGFFFFGVIFNKNVRPEDIAQR